MADADLQHPAARAAHAAHECALLLAAGPGSQVAALLEAIGEDVVALYQDNEAKDGQLADLREEGVRMAQYIVRLEEADTKHLLTISDLKTRLARAAEEIESLYAMTHHEVGDATARHIAVVRTRDLLDLNTPIPVRAAPRISAPAPSYAPPRSVAAGVK